MLLLIQIKRWFTTPVVEHFDIDRPFRLRRVSLQLIIAGWVTFLVSILVGLWLTRHGLAIAGYHELFSTLLGGGMAEKFGDFAIQAFGKATEIAGAALFIGGMISVAMFDKIDHTVGLKGAQRGRRTK